MRNRQPVYSTNHCSSEKIQIFIYIFWYINPNYYSFSWVIRTQKITTMANKAILLINIGSPDSFKTKDVRRYLKEFLSDGRVISIPALFRYFLVYGIIAPFRAPKSAKKYEEIWSDDGSPLIYHSNNLKTKLQTKYGENADVYFAMRYGNPSIKNVLKEIQQKNYSQITICPVYPQNASSTTGSSVEEVMKHIHKWENIPQLKFVNEFWNHELYKDALSQKVESYIPEEYDHVVISFHGLPLSQVYKAHEGKTCNEVGCSHELVQENKFCYQATCYQTAKNLAQSLNLNEDQYTIGFQSRLSKNWLSPFTDDILEDLANKGKKKVMVVCPSFVSDCLETIHEISIEYQEDFIKNGGKKLFLVPALNSDENWIGSFFKILES